MNMIVIRALGTLVGLGGLLAAGSVSAFTPASTQLIPLTGDTYLGVITYDLGYGEFGMQVPAQVRLASSGETSLPTYDIRSASDEVIAPTVAHAAMLSDARYADGFYSVSAEGRETFTFLTIFTVPVGVVPQAVRLTRVPFTLVTETATVPNGLSAGELGAFVAKYTDYVQ